MSPEKLDLLQGTLDLGIHYSADKNYVPRPIGYCDASFSSDRDDSKSHSGMAFFYGNGIVSHSSNKQSCVALSTMEAEYVAATEAAKESIFINNVLGAIGNCTDDPVPLYTDSKAAYDHVKNNVNHSQTKHIQRRYHYIREACNDGRVALEKIPAVDQAADVLTKPLARQKHAQALELLNMKQMDLTQA